MKHLTIIWLFLALLLSVGQVSAQENIFLDRSFWKGNPDLETVKQKIVEGNDATALNQFAFDATIYAMLEKADDDILKYLLSLEGNPIDKNTHDSRIYLHWAAYAGLTDIVEHLLNEGSSVTKLDSHGYTPLAFAANAGQTNPELFEAFEKYGINLLEEKNDSGANLLLLAAPSLSNEAELDYFLEKGFELGSKDDIGNGIFNYTAKKGNAEFLDLLIKKGVDYKSLNAAGGNAFLFAVQGGRVYSNPLSVYEYLRDLGIEPNVVTKEGYTPLHRLAYSNTDPAIFEFFLAAGADVNQKDADGNTPFLNAVYRNELAMVKLLSKDVKDFNIANNNGETALMLAVQRNSPEVVKFLLDKGGNAFAKAENGNTVAYYLLESFDSGNPSTFIDKLKLLQDKDVQFNTTQAEGNTLLHLAAKANDLELLKRIAAFDIDIDAKNDEGLTALHVAAMKAADDKMMKYLISKGADTKVKTDFEETVYDLAIENEMLQKQNTSLNFLK
ncbi:ankyrin repeat domain-containing protein [Leeuwenhoekiella sp. ZYFB001]|uniref:ankyrin repeat domain-containing protein n=1 Tax=Leeuwenhoekiella sp. ZYFB001 TaxID=2719912 RepID=UPI0014309559|nr:ankyrin repeat domain-containing protein [Leeuwenhoekiella sp. ZYFB001]